VPPLIVGRNLSTFEYLVNLNFSFIGKGAYVSPNVISTLQATKLIKEGCQAFLALITDTQNREEKIEDI